jgi:hypothetical protein
MRLRAALGIIVAYTRRYPLIELTSAEGFIEGRLLAILQASIQIKRSIAIEGQGMVIGRCVHLYYPE